MNFLSSYFISHSKSSHTFLFLFFYFWTWTFFLCVYQILLFGILFSFFKEILGFHHNLICIQPLYSIESFSSLIAPAIRSLQNVLIWTCCQDLIHSYYPGASLQRCPGLKASLGFMSSFWSSVWFSWRIYLGNFLRQKIW